MTFPDWVGIFSSITSLVLGGIAIWLALHFYDKGKDTEKAVETSLTGIRTQTDVLQKLLGRQLERLTRAVTDQRTVAVAASDSSGVDLTAILSAIHEAVKDATTRDENRPLDDPMDSLILVGYYAAVANYWAQMMVPARAQLGDSELFRSATQAVDGTFADATAITQVLMNEYSDRLESTRWPHVLAHYRTLAPNVRNAEQVLDQRDHDARARRTASEGEF